MSSLYIGEGPLERYLVDLVFNKLESHRHMRVTFVNDYHRSLRASQMPTHRLLAPLKQNFPPNNNVTVSFFRPPYVPLGLGSVPTLNEIFGVQHTKICVFDDHVLLTGANMSENYFTERQDRCVVITNCPELADYCDDFLSTVAEVGVQMDERGQMKVARHAPDCTKDGPFESRRWRDWAVERFKMHNFMHRPATVPTVEELLAKGQGAAPSSPPPPRPASDLVLATERSIQWGKKLRSVGRAEDVFNFLKDLPSDLNVVTGSGGWDDSLTEVGEAVYLFPTMQLGSLGLTDDMELLKHLLPFLQKATLASGYLNLPSELASMLSTVEEMKIICASPRANGFLGDGVKNWIPFLYRVMEERLAKRLPKAEFYEYDRPGWTFHTKGLWGYSSDSPFLTALGSSNYCKSHSAQRSYLRDLEFQLYFWSLCPKFHEKLTKETEVMLEACSKVGENTFKDPNFRCGVGTRVLASGLARFL